jgi:DNA-binding PadR family transcriptional regulator
MPDGVPAVSYLNRVIRRTRPATRCQCAVFAVLNEVWSSPDDIWRRCPVYVESKYLRIRRVGYGTINAVLRGLVQQGYAEVRGGKRKQYRQTAC